MSRLIEIVDIMTRSNHVSATEGQCVIASVIIHSELEKPTKEFGSSMLEEAKSLVQPPVVKPCDGIVEEPGWTSHKAKILSTLRSQEIAANFAESCKRMRKK